MMAFVVRLVLVVLVGDGLWSLLAGSGLLGTTRQVGGVTLFACRMRPFRLELL